MYCPTERCLAGMEIVPRLCSSPFGLLQNGLPTAAPGAHSQMKSPFSPSKRTNTFSLAGNKSNWISIISVVKKLALLVETAMVGSGRLGALDGVLDGIELGLAIGALDGTALVEGADDSEGVPLGAPEGCWETEGARLGVEEGCTVGSTMNVFVEIS